VRERLKVLYALGIWAFALAPGVAGLVWSFEAWPLTSAPMFAHYVTEQTPRYTFAFVAEPAERELDTRPTRIHTFFFSRLFFTSAYGAADPGSPLGHIPDDDREAFESRVGRFFERTEAHLRAKKRWPKKAARIRLEVRRVGAADDRFVVGRYDTTTRRFTSSGGAR
jgi:hypothetical protein